MTFLRFSQMINDSKRMIATYRTTTNRVKIVICVLFRRLGEEDNPDPSFHPCKGLFQTCCSQKSDVPNIPTIIKKEGCGYRNQEGVGFRITGTKENEAQYGMIDWAQLSAESKEQ